MKQIGSQTRELLEESGMDLIYDEGEHAENTGVILQDRGGSNPELWIKNDQYAGYVIEIDGLRVAHLGDLGHTLAEKVLTQMGDIDILIIPVGGEFTIDGAVAVNVMQAIEPKITIPMHFQTSGLNKAFSKLESEEAFLTASGLPVERIKKLSVKAATLGEDQKIVVLERK